MPAAPADPRVLVGHGTHDDAGVYRLGPDLALVQTVDFFTPIVDDPEAFGAIAAANALSDVYAMGGTPISALNLAGFPAGKLDPAILGRIMAGGRAVLDAESVALLGGHSIDDDEPKMGYAVTGTIHPDHIWRNSTASAGQVLYLTKAVGTGTLIKAYKDGVARPEWMEAAEAMMRETNREAARLVRETGGDPGAATDVTGFGLLGHAWEMAGSAGVHIRMTADAVPILPGAWDMAREDRFPGGSRKNLDWVRPHLAGRFSPDDVMLKLLADAVTSGGLLLALSPEHGARLEATGYPVRAIGRVEPGPPGLTLE